MIKFQKYIYYTLFSIIVTLSSCSDTKDFEDSNINSTFLKSSLQTEVNAHFGNNNFPFFSQSNSFNSLNYYNNDIEINHVNRMMSSPIFENFSSNFNDYYNLSINELNIAGIIFYGSNLNEDPLNDYNNISIVYRVNGKFKILSYYKNGETIVQMPVNEKEYSLITFNHLDYLANKFNHENVNVSSFFVVNNSNNSENIGLQPENIESTLLSETPIIPYSKLGGHFCKESDCDSESRGFCGYNNEQEEVICNPSGYVEDNECAEEDESLEPAPKSLVDQNYKDKMYFIRDYILDDSQLGDKYINYYYKLSYVFNVSEIYTTESQEMNEMMNYVRSKSVSFVFADNEDVIIDSNDYNYLTSKITLFKSFSNNEEYQFILNDMEQDLSIFKNKTKQQLLSLL